MYSQDLLKGKTNQELRSLCKEIGCPQYGDKQTNRTLNKTETDEVVVDDDPRESTDVKNYGIMKKEELIKLLKEKKIGGFSGKKKADLFEKLERNDAEMVRIEKEKNALDEDFGECEQCIDLPKFFAKYADSRRFFANISILMHFFQIPFSRLFSWV